MIKFLKSIKECDPAAKNILHILFLYPGVKAVFFHRIAHFFHKIKFYFLAKMIAQFSRFLTNIEISPGAVIGKHLFIDHGAGVVIGDTAVIGDRCTIYQNVTLGGVSFNKTKRHPTLSDDVVVGAGAFVLGNIYIGKGATIGANSTVLKDVEPYAVMVGNPAKNKAKKK